MGVSGFASSGTTKAASALRSAARTPKHRRSSDAMPWNPSPWQASVPYGPPPPSKSSETNAGRAKRPAEPPPPPNPDRPIRSPGRFAPPSAVPPAVGRSVPLSRPTSKPGSSHSLTGTVRATFPPPPPGVWQSQKWTFLLRLVLSAQALRCGPRFPGEQTAEEGAVRDALASSGNLIGNRCQDIGKNRGARRIHASDA